VVQVTRNVYRYFQSIEQIHTLNKNIGIDLVSYSCSKTWQPAKKQITNVQPRTIWLPRGVAEHRVRSYVSIIYSRESTLTRKLKHLTVIHLNC